MKIILASSSPRRKELLEKAGYKFDIIPSTVDEKIDASLTVEENVKNLALIKAKDIFEKNKDAIVIGADTVVALDGKIFGKPKDKEHAYLMLKELSNKSHKVISGVAILYGKEVYNFYVESIVTFRNLTDKEIYDYIDTKEVYDKAGSYAIQGLGRSLVDNYRGSLENIIGLPIVEVKDILDRIVGDN